MPTREQGLIDWLSSQLEISAENLKLSKLADDASFRKYYRFTHLGNSLVVMDADPKKEDSAKFIKIAKIFSKLGLNVPEIYAYNLELGYLVLMDLGDDLYLNKLSVDTVDKLYSDAMHTLQKLYTFNNHADIDFYNIEKVLSELKLFTDWFIDKYLKLELTAKEKNIIDETFNLLLMRFSEQPQVLVHRDFHSRNLLLTKEHNPGVIDFQDAVMGPITYDLVSLLKDCYIDWPRHKVESWVISFKNDLEKNNIIDAVSEEQFLYWFDMTGLQRHLKCLGIFARLEIRDGREGYTQYYPRMLVYIDEVLNMYPELNSFREFMHERIIAPMQENIRQNIG